MNNRSTIKIAGESALLYKDENGKSFLVKIQVLPDEEYDMILFTREIQPLYSNQKLTEKDREIIISKILELSTDIKWQIQ